MTESCMEGSSHFQVQVQLDPPHSVPGLHTGQMLEIFCQLIQKSPRTRHMVYFWKVLGTRTPMAMFQGVKHTNTQIQRQIQIEIRKYNYSGNHTIQLHFYHTYFWKALCTRTSMTMLWGITRANTQIQRHIQIEIHGSYNLSPTYISQCTTIKESPNER